MIRLVVFDFDGTLADTRELILQTNREAMRVMGYPIASDEAICATIGIPLEAGILTLVPEVTPEQVPAWVKTYREVFDSLKVKFVPTLFPEVKETLERLYGEGYTLTVASSRHSSSLNAFLKDMGIAQYFALVLGADNVSRAKPFPDPVLMTMEKLSFKPAETVVVGDMPVDIQMGLGAGAYTCGVTYGNANRAALEEAGAHAVIDHFKEFRKFVALW